MGPVATSAERSRKPVLSRAAWLWMACLLLIVASLAALFGEPRIPRTQASPRAQQGVLDLRGNDFSYPVNLNGEWEFFWQRFVAPGSFNGEPPRSDGVLSLPNTWKNLSVGNEKIAETGFATLRLRILLDPKEEPLALRVEHIQSAFKLWANGRLIAESGVPATLKEHEIADQRIQLAVLPPDSSSIDLVLQTSNFHPSWSSIRTIQLAFADVLWNRLTYRLCVIYLVSGVLMLMGIYHITLYLLRREAVSALYFGLYALFWMGNTLCIETDWAIRSFFPDLSADFLFRSYRICLIAASALSYQFLRSMYPEEFPHWIQSAFWGLSGVYIVLAAVSPIVSFVALLPFYYPFSAAKLVYSCWALFRAVRHGREGSLIILGGYIVFCAVGLNDMLNDMNVISTAFVMQFGMLVFMIAQALALAFRFSRLFSSVEQLSGELTEKNRVLEKEIGERIRVQQDIVTVSEAERSRISHELHDGLCQQLTGARLLCSSIRKKWSADEARSNELARLSSVLDMSVGHAYDLSRGLWPVEAGSGDLCKALSELVQKHRDTSPIPIELVVQSGCGQCDCINAAHIHSIAREAIVNAVKHANPQRICVCLTCHDQKQAVLTVSDDGVGWVPERRAKSRGGLGLRIMAYRSRMVGGDFRIETRPEGGSRVVSTMPCLAAENKIS